MFGQNFNNSNERQNMLTKLSLVTNIFLTFLDFIRQKK